MNAHTRLTEGLRLVLEDRETAVRNAVSANERVFRVTQYSARCGKDLIAAARTHTHLILRACDEWDATTTQLEELRKNG